MNELTVPVITQHFGNPPITTWIVVPHTTLSARELIAQHVQQELEAVATAHATSLLNLLGMTATALEPAAAIEQALQAWEQRQYLLIVDGGVVMTLEQPLAIHPDSQVRFVRLTPLIGG